MSNGFTAVVGPHTVGLALGLMEFRQRPDVVATALWPSGGLHSDEDYLMWEPPSLPGAGARGASGLDGTGMGHRGSALCRVHWWPYVPAHAALSPSKRLGENRVSRSRAV